MGTAVGIGTSIIGGIGQQRAISGAAQAQEDAANKNVQFLESSGRAGAQDIANAAQQGISASQLGLRATEPLQRFADVGGQAFQTARDSILGGPQGSALSRAIAQGGENAALSRFSPSRPVRRAIQMQARLSGMEAQTGFNQELLGVGQGAGIGGVTDIAQIRARQADTEGNIARQSGAQQATALVGQVPQVAAQMQTGQDARLLGDLGTQQLQTGAAEQVAQLIGRNV